MVQRAVVVGGSGGIGQALTQQLLETGWQVLATARSLDVGTPLAQLHEQYPDALRCQVLDLGDAAQIESLGVQLAEKGQPVSLLINASGVLHDGSVVAPEKRLEDLSFESLARGFAINSIAPALLAKALWRVLKHPQRAVFASLSARVGSIGDNRLGGWYGYRASKAAQNQIIRTLAIEMRRRAPNLICAALHPGTVDTALSAPFNSRVAADKLFSCERAARQLLAVVAGLTPEQSGGLFAWDGSAIAW